MYVFGWRVVGGFCYYVYIWYWCYFLNEYVGCVLKSVFSFICYFGECMVVV